MYKFPYDEMSCSIMFDMCFAFKTFVDRYGNVTGSIMER